MDTQLVKALLNPMRIRILDAVTEAPSSPSQLAASLGENLDVVSYHVGVMRTTGCLRPVRRGHPRRGDQCVYELTPEAAPARRRISSRRLPPSDLGHPSAGMLRALVERGAAGLEAPGERRADRLGCMSVELDREGMRQVSAAIAGAIDKVSAAQEASARRLAGTGESAIEATIALASFASPVGSDTKPAR